MRHSPTLKSDKTAEPFFHPEYHLPGGIGKVLWEDLVNRDRRMMKHPVYDAFELLLADPQRAVGVIDIKTHIAERERALLTASTAKRVAIRTINNIRRLMHQSGLLGVVPPLRPDDKMPGSATLQILPSELLDRTLERESAIREATFDRAWRDHSIRSITSWAKTASLNDEESRFLVKVALTRETGYRSFPRNRIAKDSALHLSILAKLGNAHPKILAFEDGRYQLNLDFLDSILGSPTLQPEDLRLDGPLFERRKPQDLHVIENQPITPETIGTEDDWLTTTSYFLMEALSLQTGRQYNDSIIRVWLRDPKSMLSAGELNHSVLKDLSTKKAKDMPHQTVSCGVKAALNNLGPFVHGGQLKNQPMQAVSFRLHAIPNFSREDEVASIWRTFRSANQKRPSPVPDSVCAAYIKQGGSNPIIEKLKQLKAAHHERMQEVTNIRYMPKRAALLRDALARNFAIETWKKKDLAPMNTRTGDPLQYYIPFILFDLIRHEGADWRFINDIYTSGYAYHPDRDPRNIRTRTRENIKQLYETGLIDVRFGGMDKPQHVRLNLDEMPNVDELNAQRIASRVVRSIETSINDNLDSEPLARLLASNPNQALTECLGSQWLISTASEHLPYTWESSRRGQWATRRISVTQGFHPRHPLHGLEGQRLLVLPKDHPRSIRALRGKTPNSCWVIHDPMTLKEGLMAKSTLY